MLEFDAEVLSQNLQNWNPMDLQKMIFIYRALETGWCVRKLRDGRFEFKKPTEDVHKEMFLEDYLKRFILYNLCMQHFQNLFPARD
jgi:hypothetical protein